MRIDAGGRPGAGSVPPRVGTRAFSNARAVSNAREESYAKSKAEFTAVPDISIDGRLRGFELQQEQ